MPIIKSAKKAARQAEKRTKHNTEIKKAIKAAFKEFEKKPSAMTLSKAQSEIDKAVKKDLLDKNTAARRKAKLHEIAKKANVKLEKKATKKVEAKKTVAKKPAAKKATTAKTTKAGAKKTQSKAKKAA